MNDDKSPISAIYSKQFETRLEMLKEGFAAMEKVNVRTVPEYIFLQYFLPFFCGDTNENAQDLLNHWFTIAGNTYAAVNIVNNNGEFVIQVPPIHDRTTLSPILDRDQDIAYTFTVAQAKASLSPTLANNIINNGLGERFNSMVNNDKSNPVLKEQWIKLFQHYGKISKEVAKANLQNNGDEDEFEW
jgi:hypothetical protein